MYEYLKVNGAHGVLFIKAYVQDPSIHIQTNWVGETGNKRDQILKRLQCGRLKYLSFNSHDDISKYHLSSFSHTWQQWTFISSSNILILPIKLIDTL